MECHPPNYKHPCYLEDHELYLGTVAGGLKRVRPGYWLNPFEIRDLNDSETLAKKSRVTALSFDCNGDILVGRFNGTIELHTLLPRKMIGSRYVHSSPVVGVSTYADDFLVGLYNGQLRRIPWDYPVRRELVICTGDQMRRMRQSPTDRSAVACGGHGPQNNIKVFDIGIDGKFLFASRNVEPDFLQLELPVRDTDVGFFESPQTVATCSHLGYVHIYDGRIHRRPVARYDCEWETHVPFTSMAIHEKYLYVSTNKDIKAFDIRRMDKFLHHYKGFQGCVHDINLDMTGTYIASVAKDGCVRVHQAHSTVLLYQCYLEPNPTRVLIAEEFSERMKRCFIADCSDEEDEPLNEDESKYVNEINEMINNDNRSREQHLAEYEEFADLMNNIGFMGTKTRVPTAVPTLYHSEKTDEVLYGYETSDDESDSDTDTDTESEEY